MKCKNHLKLQSRRLVINRTRRILKIRQRKRRISNRQRVSFMVIYGD